MVLIMTKKKLLIGTALALVVSTVITLEFKGSFDRRKNNRVAVREYFDVRSKGVSPVKAFTLVKSVSCRKASVDEIRKSEFAQNGDLVLDIIHNDGAKTTFEISEYVRLESAYLNSNGGNDDAYNAAHKRLRQFGVDFTFLMSSDCSDWEDGITENLLK